MANYPQVLAQDAVCQSHTGHMTGLWFLPARPIRLNTNEWNSLYGYSYPKIMWLKMDEWKVLQWTVEYVLISVTVGTLLLRLSFLMMIFWFQHQKFACIMYEMSASSLPLQCMKACIARRMNMHEIV